MSARVTSRRLVGRSAELAELTGLVETARGGESALAFVAGESGVGKTRLVTELEGHAREGGARILGGDCVELGEGGELPYAPLVSALRPLVRRGDPALDELTPGARADLATLLPELGSADTPPATDEAAQRRLFEALLGLLEALGRDDVVVLSIEDIHWADRSTRAFLSFLARSVCNEHLLVIATYRSDELHRRHPVLRLLAELQRHPRARQIALARLDRDELAAQLEDILGEAPDDALVERLYARSEGNPLFTEELLAVDGDGRSAAPPTLREALMVRVERLSPDAQELLRVLAVAGRADHALLAGAGELAPRALREALREAVAAHIVATDDDGGHAFRHELLREVVHDDLLPGEHAELHLTIARTLEERAEREGGGAWLTAAIAQHYRRGGDQPAALTAAVRAAAAAERVSAYGEAAALLERALELWARVPDASDVAGVDHVTLVMRAARAHAYGGDEHRRTALLERALAETDQASQPRRTAELLGELSDARWELGRGDEARTTLRRALDLLSGDEPSPERAQLLFLEVRQLLLQSRYREAAEAGARALEAATAVGDEGLRGRILNRMGMGLIASGRPDEGVEALQQAIAVARRLRDAHDLTSAYSNLIDALHGVGRDDEARAALAQVRAEGSLDGFTSLCLDLTGSEIAFDRGEWDEMAELLPARAPELTGNTLAHLRLREAEFALGRGEHAVARAALDEARALLSDSIEPQYIGTEAALRGELERRGGALDEARAAIEEGVDRIEFCSEDVRRLAQLAAVGAAIEADAAQLARDRDDAETLARELSRLSILVERARATAPDGRPVERAHRLTAEAEALRGRGEPAAAAWRAAAEAWGELGRRYLEAVMRWSEAEALVAGGEREDARAAAVAAHATAVALDAGWLRGEVESLAARARLELEAPVADGAASGGEPGSVPALDDEPFGLTPRELQVLSLVAGGATNREIGAELFMAEKTASVHVSRILAKLGVRSRTEAAAVAYRQGLDRVPA